MYDEEKTLELIERLARLVTNEGHALGLKPAQWEGLRYLARANRFSRTPGGLTAYLGLTKGTVSQTLMSLERGGLVEKTAHPGDGRSVRLELSPAGRALLERDGMADVGHALASLPRGQQAALREGLTELVRVMLSVRRGRAFGLCRDCRHFARDALGPDAHFCRLLGEPLEEDEADQICQEQQAA